MQSNQMNQQMNTYFIQASQPIASIQNPNIFQQIQVPNSNNLRWSVSLTPPISVGQNNQRIESKPNENFIFQNRPPMIISGNTIGFNQRFISPNNIVTNQPQISPIQKYPSVQQQQIQIQQQHQPQQQQQQQQSQQQIRQVNTQLQRVASNPLTDNPIIEIKDNSVVSIISNTASLGGNNQTNNSTGKLKEEVLEEREESVDSKNMVNSNRIAQMVRQIDEHLQLDEDMKGIFSQYLDDFLQNVTENACKLAKLRNSDTLETKDFQYIMERDWGIYVPGYSPINEKPRQNNELEIHKTRLNIIRKSNR